MESNALIVLNTNDALVQNSRDSFLDACRRWNCDYVEVKENLTIYEPIVSKFKYFERYPYERIFALDSDLIIWKNAPNPFELFPPGKFYATRNQQPQLPTVYHDINPRMYIENTEWILRKKTLLKDIPVEYLSKNFFNAGVWLADREDEEVFALGYYYWVGVGYKDWCDMVPLNMALHMLREGFYETMPDGWNYCFPENIRKMNAYIYHLAGWNGKYELLRTVRWDE